MEHNLGLVFEDTLKKLNSNKKDLIQSVMIFTAPHLEKVNFSPNGRVNLLTVNEPIRLQANMLDWMSFE